MVTIDETPKNIWVPEGPYVFKSGDRKGRSLECLMFSDYPFLNWYYDAHFSASSGNKNELHRHLEWILARGNDRIPKILCPQCGIRQVRKYSVVNLGFNNEISVGYKYTSCNHQDCIDTLLSSELFQQIALYSFKFKYLLKFKAPSNLKKVVELYKTVFLLPSRISGKIAFEFFNEYTDELFPDYA